MSSIIRGSHMRKIWVSYSKVLAIFSEQNHHFPQKQQSISQFAKRGVSCRTQKTIGENDKKS